MRVLLFALALLLVLPAAPSVQAAHRGPCIHEYFGVAEYLAAGGDAYQAAEYVAWCVGGTVVWACQLARCDQAIDIGPLP